MAGIPTGNNIPTGGNVLSSTGNVVSGNNIPSTSTAATPPGTVLLWFDAQNIDGTNNSSLVDGQALALWKNLGSLGAAGNMVQATGANKPVYRAVAVSGKIGNKSAVEAVDGARFMVSNGFTTIAQPAMFATVFRSNDKTSVEIDITTPGSVWQWYIAGGAGGTIHIRCTADVDTGLNPAVNTFHSSVANYNGASSVVTLNGTSSAAINPGSLSSGTQITWMDQTGGAGLIGYHVEKIVATGTTAAALEAYFATKYGAFPQ